MPYEFLVANSVISRLDCYYHRRYERTAARDILTRVPLGLNCFINNAVTNAQGIEVECDAVNGSIADELVLRVEKVKEARSVVTFQASAMHYSQNERCVSPP